MTAALQPIYNNAIAYKQGFVISVTGNTTLSVTSGVARANNDAMDINVGDFYGAQTATVVDATVNGLNGLDTGSLQASKVYALWAIADGANYNPAGLLLSLSLTAPQLPSGQFPSGYNEIRRVGWAVTDASSHFKVLFVSGEGSVVRYTYDVPVKVLTGGTSATQAAVDLSSVVPAKQNIPVDLNCDFLSDAASKKATLCPSGGTIASSRFILNAQVAAVHVIQDYTIPAVLISGLPKVDYIISAATSSLDLYVNGFTDILA